MSNEQELSKPLGKYNLITDPKIIAELDKLELYIPPNETEETYDQEIISGQGHDLSISSGSVGQLRPIEVAVWFDDPNKQSTNSIDRIHLRIINGRHRYKVDPKWRRQYYDFSGYVKSGGDPILEYYLAKGHFDMQKKATKEERRVWVTNMCEHAMKNLGIDAPKCCDWVVKLALEQGVSSKTSITEVCPTQFKSAEHMGKKGKTFEATGKETEKIKKLKKIAGEKYVELEAQKIKLETENTRLQKENIGLHEQANESQRIMDDVQQQLRLVKNIEQEATCECGRKTILSVDPTSGKILVSEQKGSGKVVM